MDSLQGSAFPDVLGPKSANFAFWRVCFWLIPTHKSHLSEFPGSLIRSALGRTLKKCSCIAGDPDSLCRDCAEAAVCAYGYSFETPLDRESQERLSAPFAPHPFVLALDTSLEKTEKGLAPLALELTLVGRGRTHLARFVQAVREMCHDGLGEKRQTFRLDRIEDLHPAGSGTIQSGDSALFIDSPRDFTLGDLLPLRSDCVHVKTVSPLRILSKGSPVESLDFPLLLRAIFRRIGALARFHCDLEPEVDYRGLLGLASGVALVHQNLAWSDLRRYSARQSRRMVLGGVVGSFVLEGPMSPFTSFLRLGEALHVGKGTAFGLGRYRLEEESSRHDSRDSSHQS